MPEMTKPPERQTPRASKTHCSSGEVDLMQEVMQHLLRPKLYSKDNRSRFQALDQQERGSLAFFERLWLHDLFCFPDLDTHTRPSDHGKDAPCASSVSVIRWAPWSLSIARKHCISCWLLCQNRYTGLRDRLSFRDSRTDAATSEGIRAYL